MRRTPRKLRGAERTALRALGNAPAEFLVGPTPTLESLARRGLIRARKREIQYIETPTRAALVEHAVYELTSRGTRVLAQLQRSHP